MNTGRRRRLTRRLARRCPAMLTAMALVASSACGIRTDPRPPELTMPESPGDFSVRIENAEVRLHWNRPKESLDGQRLTDLAGFVIERRTEDADFAVLAEVLTSDRERIRPQAGFKWRDLHPVEGLNYYRVRAFTDDGQTGSPSAGTPIEVGADVVENARSLREAESTAPAKP